LIPSHPSVTIVDDFYEDLSWVDDHLRAVKGRAAENVNFAGLVFETPPDVREWALKKIEREFNLSALSEANYADLRLTLAEHQNTYKTLVHVDLSMNVIIYLRGREGLEYGTSFYRHRDLDLFSIHEPSIQTKKISSIFMMDTLDLSRWELIHQVPFKQNRAICFDGRYFHAIPPNFYGKDQRDGRVTQNFFFRIPDEAGV
jgi:hypothetical protein